MDTAHIIPLVVGLLCGYVGFFLGGECASSRQQEEREKRERQKRK